MEHAQKEVRMLQSELFHIKNSTEETVDSLETFNRENKNLGEEVTELNEQIHKVNPEKMIIVIFGIILSNIIHLYVQNSKEIHELEKSKRSAESERAALQQSLEEAEASVESEEAKCLRIQVSNKN